MLTHVLPDSDIESAWYVIMFDRDVSSIKLDTSMIPHVFNMDTHMPITLQPELMDAVRFFEGLKPYGQGFMAPVFSVVFRRDDVSEFRMADKQHIKFTFKNKLQMIMWNGASDWDIVKGNMYVATGRIGVNSYRDNESLEIIIDDLRVIP